VPKGVGPDPAPRTLAIRLPSLGNGEFADTHASQSGAG
jgi:hypothetical protein